MQVTGNLVFIFPTSGTFTEVSQVQPIQGRTRYAYTALISSASAPITSVKVELQWSNDMDNWQTVALSDVTITAFPNNVSRDNSGSTSAILPGEFARLRYTFIGGVGGGAALSATLSLKSN